MSDILKSLKEQEEEFGIWEIGEITTDKVFFSEGVRKLCEMNTCGLYGKTWACPPGVGTYEECREKIRRFENMLVYTTLHKLEDSYDVEGMEAGRDEHILISRRVYDYVRNSLNVPLLYIGAEGCGICKKCTYPESSCRFPDKMSPSIESYGVEVNRLAKAAGVNYINGKNTVTFFSCICY